MRWVALDSGKTVFKGAGLVSPARTKCPGVSTTGRDAKYVIWNLIKNAFSLIILANLGEGHRLDYNGTR